MEPTSSASALTLADLACPRHGVIVDALGKRCPHCDTQLYNLQQADDAAIMRSLRKVAQSQRLTRARVLTFPIAFVLLVLIFGAGMITFLLTASIGEVLARAIEPLLRRGQRPALRELDRRVL